MARLVSSYRDIPYRGGESIRRKALKARLDGFSYPLGSQVRMAGSWRLEMLDTGSHFYGVC